VVTAKATAVWEGIGDAVRGGTQDDGRSKLAAVVSIAAVGRQKSGPKAVDIELPAEIAAHGGQLPSEVASRLRLLRQLLEAEVGHNDVFSMLRHVFWAFDSDNNGYLDKDEFFLFLTDLMHQQKVAADGSRRLKLTRAQSDELHSYVAESTLPNAMMSPAQLEQALVTGGATPKNPADRSQFRRELAATPPSDVTPTQMVKPVTGNGLELTRVAEPAVVEEGQQDPSGAVRLPKGWRPQEVDMLRRQLRAAAFNVGGQDIAALVKQLGKDRSNSLEYEEFRIAVRKEGKLTAGDFPDAAVLKLFRLVDVDSSGTVTVEELELFLQPAPSGRPTTGGKLTLGRSSSGNGVLFLKKKTPWEIKRDEAAARVEQLKGKLRAAAYFGGKQDYHRLFGNLDRDSSKALEWPEFNAAIRKFGQLPKNKLPDSQLQTIFRLVDTDGSGEVDADEFAAFLDPGDVDAYGRTAQHKARLDKIAATR
jgi:Ca2+-binding EF-hand superfamily protein